MPDQASSEPAPPRFRIATLLWLTALLASAMGSFGPGLGCLLALGVSGLHIVPRRKVTQLPWGIIAAVLASLGAVLLPAIQVTRGHPKFVLYDVHVLKLLHIAASSYHEENGVFPPAYATDEAGAALHSWRTLLLPYIERPDIYDRLAIEEPWDSATNCTPLQGSYIQLYQSLRDEAAGAPPDTASFFAVADDAAVLRPSTGVRAEDISDGLDETILFVSARQRGIRWYEPRDLSLDEAVDLLTTERTDLEPIDEGLYLSTYYRGHMVVFADGRVASADCLTDRDTARALLTPSGGEVIPEETLKRMRGPLQVSVVHWLRIFSTALFAALAVAPLFRKRSVGPPLGEA